MQTLGQRIQDARNAKGYTIEQLAHRMSIKPSTLKKWESGETDPRANKLNMLSGMLGVSLAWMLNGDSDFLEDIASPDGNETGELSRKIELLLTMHQRSAQLLFELGSEIRRLQAQMDEINSEDDNGQAAA